MWKLTVTHVELFESMHRLPSIIRVNSVAVDWAADSCHGLMKHRTNMEKSGQPCQILTKLTYCKWRSFPGHPEPQIHSLAPTDWEVMRTKIIEILSKCMWLDSTSCLDMHAKPPTTSKFETWRAVWWISYRVDTREVNRLKTYGWKEAIWSIWELRPSWLTCDWSVNVLGTLGNASNDEEIWDLLVKCAWIHGACWIRKRLLVEHMKWHVEKAMKQGDCGDHPKL